MSTILATVAIISVLGFLGAVVLIVVSRVTAVEEDGQLAYVNGMLPGVNCGSCGYASCEAYAKAVLYKGAPTNACTVGGDRVAVSLAQFLGVDAQGVVRKSAYVACHGTANHIDPHFVFEGTPSCRTFSTMNYKSMSCPYGCLGFGDCAALCPFDAITMDNGTAVIDPHACTGCGKCLDVCPRNVIKMAELASGNDVHPYSVAAVRCNNVMKGKDVRSNACDVGCIGCMKCKKACPEDAIVIENNLARVNAQKCTNCGACLGVCPTSIINTLVFS